MCSVGGGGGKTSYNTGSLTKQSLEVETYKSTNLLQVRVEVVNREVTLRSAGPCPRGYTMRAGVGLG